MDDHDPRCKCLRCTRPCAHDGGDIEYTSGGFGCDKCFEVRSRDSNPGPLPNTIGIIELFRLRIRLQQRYNKCLTRTADPPKGLGV